MPAINQRALRGGLLGACVLVAIQSGSASAQSEPAPAPAATPAAQGQAAFGDIVVTANRRAEAIQSVPVSVTALSGAALREQNVNTSADLLGKIPSLVVSGNGLSRSGETITIRGQGQTYGAPVGVVNYFAEVPLIQGSVESNQGGPGSFFDLESLQVLRGPQGTLFGKNTTGGALLLGPRKPTNRFGGYVQAQVGNYSDREFEGAINIPIVDDKLMVRIAGQKVDRHGFTKDVGPQAFGYSVVSTPDCPVFSGFPGGACTPSTGFKGKDYDDRHYWTGRVGVLWRPSDRFENYLLATITRSHTNGNGNVPGEINLATCNLANLGFNIAYGGAAPFNVPDCGLGAGNAIASSARSAQLIARQRQLGARRVAYNTDQFERLHTWSIIDTASYKLTDELTLRNVFGYQRMKQNYALDLDGSVAPVISQLPETLSAAALALDPTLGSVGDKARVTDLSQLSVEPQLQGKVLDNKLNFVLGFFYSKTRPEGLEGQASFNANTFGNAYYSVTTRSTAVYGQATLDFGAFSPALDGLKLTGGIRKTWDRVDGSRVNPSFYSLPVASAVVKSAPTTWTAGIDYQATRRVLLYGKITRGYKGGGFNPVGPRVAALTFKPEYVTSYEIGAKTDFKIGDMPTRFNVSAYNLDYKDIQRAISDNVPSANPTTGLDQGAITFNADRARVRGIELEAIIQPVAGLQLSGNYSYTDAKYEKFVFVTPAQPFYPGIRTYDTCNGPVAIPFSGAGVAVDLSCSPFPYAPKHLFNLNARYEHSLGERVGTLVGSVNYSYVGRQFVGATTTRAAEPSATLKGYGVVNLSLELNDISGAPVDARFFVTNAANKLYRVSNGNGTSNVLGFSQWIFGEPRMYGFSLRYRFGEGR